MLQFCLEHSQKTVDRMGDADYEGKAASPHHDTQVAVVGGGMAGLAAASALSEAGLQVILLEASDYFGGRVKQVQPFEGFAPIDLGGEFIHGSDSIITRRAKENGWVVQPCYKCEGMEKEYMFFYKDEFHPLLNSHPDIQKAWKAWDDIIFLWDKISKSELHESAKNASREDNGKSAESHHVDLDSESKANSAQAELEEATEIVSIPNPGDDAEDFKDMSIQQWLERQKCNDDVMAVFDSMYCQTVAAAPSQMGLYECAREENAWTYGDGNFRLAGSYSLLVEHFLNKCSEVEKRLCWQVTEVNWKGENGKDKTGGHICLKNQLGQTLTAKYVIITVPLTILKDGDINFIPPLPASKKRAIDGIEMRGALKIVCRFKSQFWPDNLNLIYRVRGFVSQIWMYTHDSMKSAEKCHLIAGFQTAEPAEEKINLSEQEVLDGFLQDLDNIFRTASNPYPATDSFTDYVYYHWSKHPYIRGGYSSPTVHANGLRHELGRPVEDHLFFAGEATSVTACATVHTATETGLRAAREVCSIVTRVITESVMPEKLTVLDCSMILRP